MAREHTRPQYPHVQVIEARRTSTPVATYAAIVLALLVGSLFLGVGVAIAYLAITTPLVSDVSRLGQGRVAGPLAGTLVWALAFIVPGALVVFGLARLVTALERSLALRGRRLRPVAAHAQNLPDDYSVAESVRLPDRRVVPEVVVGPHGLLVVEELPPPSAIRHRGPFWEVRIASGRWVPIENPLERAQRDAERLRHWVANSEGDFSPRIYAAVVADGHDLERTGGVAVLTRAQLPAFLASMPPARQMTPERRARVVELLRRAV